MKPPMIISLKQQIMQFFHPEFLLNKAKNCGFIKRQRTLEPSNLLLCLISAMSTGKCDAIAGIHRQYNGMALSEADMVSYKPFHNQLRKVGFPDFLKRVTEHAIANFSQHCLKGMPEKFACFDEILLQDGCSFRVSDKLEETYPCRFKKIKAAVECHMTMSLMTASPVNMTITADTASERTYLPNATNLQQKLLLADAGYPDFTYFEELSKHGGSFIMHANKKLNPLILSAINGNGKSQSKLVGKKLQDVTRRTNRAEVLDLIVQRGKYTFRVIRRWFAEEKRFCIWVTNLPRDIFSADDIMYIYRLRWQIELMFKELKSHTSWRRFNTEQKPIVDGFIWASLLALVLRRSIAIQLKPDVSLFKAAKNSDVWLSPIFQACVHHAWSELQNNLEWACVYLQRNAVRSQQRKSIAHWTQDDILRRFNA